MILKQIQESVTFIAHQTQGYRAELGIILGTGLGGLINEIEIEHTLEYIDIPHFPISTVESHTGRLIFGKLSGKNIVAMQGRFHFYEGYSMQQVTYPVRVPKYLGIENLIVSNACGALNPDIKAGDLMILRDHINLLPANPLIGKNFDELGPRFPDMSQPYSPMLRDLAKQIAAESGDKIHEGVYVAVSGPNLETAAEYKYLLIIGGDVVGMSTVPEVLVAIHMGIPCFAISVITDECWHEVLTPVSIAQVISVAMKTEPRLTHIIKEIAARV